MIKIIFKDYKAIHLVIVTSILLTVSSLRAEESPALESFSDGTKEYLSDPARTGSLVGTILAGAALANPLAPLIGSVAGFFIGKTSDYSDRGGNSLRSVYSSRSFIPKDDIQVLSLTGLTGKPPQETEQAGVLALAQETMTVNQREEARQPAIVEPTREIGGQGSQLQLQLGSACNNVRGSQPLPVFCYYYSQ